MPVLPRKHLATGTTMRMRVACLFDFVFFLYIVSITHHRRRRRWLLAFRRCVRVAC